MPTNKTTKTNAKVEVYLAQIDGEAKRTDCAALAKLMAETTQEPPKMWGTSIVGFGHYRYRYESGREGEMCLVGFSSRKADISIYGLGMGGVGEDLLARLGKYKAGKGCLNIKRLGDIDLGALKQLITDAMTRKRVGQSDA